MKRKTLTLVSLILVTSMLAGCTGPWSIYGRLKDLIFGDDDNYAEAYAEEE